MNSQQKKWKNKGEEPEKINTSFTNQKTEEETKHQGNVALWNTDTDTGHDTDTDTWTPEMLKM